MDYIDLYLIHWPQAGNKYEDTFRALNKLVRDGKIKHIGVSNFSVKLLQQSQKLSETPILTNQVPFSISDRSYVKNGVLEYCQRNDIFLTAYEPVNQGNLNSNAIIEVVAKSHHATIFQIALAWVISYKSVITIPMSFNPQHIQENFEAGEIKLSEDEIEKLNSLWKVESRLVNK
jgi:diketogulonate reductase-like aldo/keto reductase